MKRKLALSAIAVLTAVTIGAGYAANSVDNDTRTVQQAKISLTEAIEIAERHVGGKAIRAELEDENGTLVYGVEVGSGAQTTDVKVDLSDGKILSAQADHEGEDREDQEQDDD